MLIKGIDLPEELLRAQAAGEMVVFAGAGVSCPPPSSLPLFDGLAKQIGLNSELQYNAQEPTDRYLGRLKQKGVRVHEAARGILVNETTRPHDLHKLLLQLFPGSDKVRLVTTNFDIHFTTVGQEHFKGTLEIFTAPALPLGDDFSGLVYLHGCAGTAPAKCVLTDEDFGRAYLTQGWAARFLAAMFSRYVVLFVGYSHNDPVMHYLARGLPPVSQRTRYAFTTDDPESSQKWELLGIRSLIYKKVAGENHHLAITDSVREWVSELQRGLLEKSPRIQAIAKAQPPFEGEDADYIKHVLLDIHTARIFFKNAKSPEWISWMEKHQFLQPLFDRKAELSTLQNELGSWVVENFLDKHPQDLMAALERNGGGLNPKFCWWIWRRLNFRKQKPVSNDLFLKWTVILLAQPFTALDPENWSMLLQSCGLPEDKDAALLLFDHITKPRIELEKAWRLLDNNIVQDKVDFGLNFHRGPDEHWAFEAWRETLLPNLSRIASELEPIVLANLVAAHRLANISGPKDRNFDTFYVHRQSIKKHEQDHIRNLLDLLIDAAREISDLLILTKPRQAATRFEEWFESDISILRRLAVYGYAQRSDLAPAEKLRWVEDNKLLFIFKSDVFWLIQKSYPKAPNDARRRFVEFVLFSRPELGGAEVPEQSIQYEIFNILVWLKRVAPDCVIAHEKLDQFKQDHPDFSEREFPELGHSSTGVRSINTAEGLDPDDVAAKPASDFLDALLAWTPRFLFDRDRSGYCSTVSTVVSKKPGWGVEWIGVLIQRNLRDKDLWYCVCLGWRNANLTHEQWKVVLDVVESVDAPPEFFSSFTQVLEHGSRRETFTLPDDLMEQAQRVATRVWKLALADAPVDAETSRDWLGAAINTSGGKLAEFWLSRLSSARKAAGDDWRGIPTPIAEELRKIIQGTSDAAQYGRVVFASQLHYFFSLDKGFAFSEILPLFDWSKSALRAEQSWHGFLFWGRWLPGFTQQLLPFFDELVRKNAALEERCRENLIHHLAILALFWIDDPLANSWLPANLSHLSNEDRDAFASDIDRYLRDAETNLAEKIWERWLSRFWSMRLLNTPTPLLPKEANEMVYWCFSVGQYFPNAVELALKMRGIATFEHASLFYRLHQKQDLVKSYPDATADLILFFLKTPPPYFSTDDESIEVWKLLKSAGADPDKLQKIRDELYRFGRDPGQP